MNDIIERITKYNVSQNRTCHEITCDTQCNATDSCFYIYLQKVTQTLPGLGVPMMQSSMYPYPVMTVPGSAYVAPPGV